MSGTVPPRRESLGHEQTHIVSIDVNRMCSGATIPIASSASILTTDAKLRQPAAPPALMELRPANAPPGAVPGSQAIFLSEHFTAELVKPESLLCGVDTPLIKKEPDLGAGDVSAQGNSGVAATWCLTAEQQQQLQQQHQWQRTQQTETEVQQLGHLLHTEPPSLELKKGDVGPPPLIVPLETSPDSASATPSAPYMFESRERLFSCEFCPNIRFTRSQLRRHKAVHFGQRNYVCHDCGKKYTSKHTLETHQILHGRVPVSRKMCSKRLSAAPSLPNHEKLQSPESRVQSLQMPTV